MRTVESPEQAAHRCARELLAALEAAGRRYLRYGETIGDSRVTLGVRDRGPTADDSADLPPDLRRARPATRQAYRTLRALRDERGPDAAVWPADLEARMRADDPAGLDTSIHTINHALHDLRALRLAWVHPARGYQLGREQQRLPVFGGQSAGASLAAPLAHTSGAAGDPARPYRRPSMKAYIWVPGETTEYGLVLVDPVTEAGVLVTERLGEMRVPTKTGRLATVPAVRAELVRVEGRTAVVKVPGHQVRTRVLGDWQLEGHAGPTATGAA